MREYHKIKTVYLRDPETKFKTLLSGQFALSEFEYLKDNVWIWTEKVDGTNIRVMWNGDKVVFGGKTDNAQIPVFLLYKLQELFEETSRKELLKETFTDKKTGELMDDVCLYGEGYGAKIQKGGGNYIPDGVDFILFDVKIGDWWLQRKDVVDIADKLNLKVVPIIGKGTLDEAVQLASDGFNSEWNGDFLAEGLVMRPEVELKTRSGHRIITKIKHKDFKEQK